jgi:hypothetical protein
MKALPAVVSITFVLFWLASCAPSSAQTVAPSPTPLNRPSSEVTVEAIAQDSGVESTVTPYELELIRPVGLYQLYHGDSGLYRLYREESDGRSQQLAEALYPLLPAPDAAHAVYMDDSGRLWLVDLADGDERQLAEGADLSSLHLWGDARTLLVGVYLSATEREGLSSGHVATLDIVSGALQIVEEEYLSLGRPAMAPDGQSVAYDISIFSTDAANGRIYRPDEGSQPVDPALFDGLQGQASCNLRNPAWSPDGGRLAWLCSGEAGSRLVVLDLQRRTGTAVLTWQPAQFGALPPSAVWSPDGKWLAIEVWAGQNDDAGLWLLPAGGTLARVHIPTGHDPIWLNPSQLIYADLDQDMNGDIKLYDLDRGAIGVLDLPAGSAMLLAPPYVGGQDDSALIPEPSAAATPSAGGGFDCASVSQIPVTECEALVSLYDSTNGPGWIDNSGWLATSEPCAWTGITCTAGHVSHISLAYNRLAGPLPPALGDLSQLRAVELGSNQLRGPIPAELAKLSELASLYLWDNQLTGPLPLVLENLDKLRSLYLAHNQLSGSIPPEMGGLKSLESLDLSYNQFEGTIPPELGELDNLYLLYLSHNKLSGGIPVTFDNLSKLDDLDLSYNLLHGAVTESISRINELRLWGNQLDGTLATSGQTPFTVDALGVHFVAEASLATSIWQEARPASPLPEDLEGPGYWLAIPEHLRFTFADPGLSPERRRMGFSVAAEGQILIFPLAELADMSPMVQEKIETLRGLLAERGPAPAGELPLLPPTNSAQVFHAQAQYLDSGNLHGLRFISQHSQDPQPIMLSQEVFYTFQGLTDDGAYYVAIFYPLTTAALPDTIEIQDWQAFHANYDTYLAETTAVLDQLAATGFRPELSLLDALVTSLRIEPGIWASGNLQSESQG